MDKLTIKAIKASEIKLLNPLIDRYLLSEWRRYRIFTNEEQVRYIIFHIRQLIQKNSENILLIAFKRNIPVGLALFCFLDWDSLHFGINMAAIKYLISEGSYFEQIEIKNQLLQRIVEISRCEHVSHVSFRVDSEDYSSLFCLPNNGFYFMDTLVTYVLRPSKVKIPYIKSLCSVRPFHRTDLSRIMNIARDSFQANRFCLDPFLNPQKSKTLYERWIKNHCEGKRQENIIWIAERKGKIIGFLSYMLNKEIERITGKQVWGHGLGAIIPSAKGAYPSLLSFAIERHGNRGNIIEFDALLTNMEANRVYQHFGLMLTKTQHTWHRWLQR